jgi:hypothetical protein
VAARGRLPITGQHAPRDQRTDFLWRNKTFREHTLKLLILFVAPNQPFRGNVSFQSLTRRFASPFSHFPIGRRSRRRFRSNPASQ